MPGKHAKLSASGAKKWLNCPLSVAMESKFPNESSEYAEEGTIAHALGELKIRLAVGEISKRHYDGEVKKIINNTKIEVNREMYEYTDSYRDFVIERFNEAKKKTPDAVLMLEQKLDFSEYVPEGFGTGDAVIIADGNMEIIDLKYGRGILVSAKDNPQLRLYALGALCGYDYIYDIKSVTMTIYQPRMDNISSQIITADELVEWGGEAVKPKARDAYNSIGECNPGKHCDEGFCRARAICKAYSDRQSELARYDFIEAKIMTNDDIADVLSKVDALVSWANLIKSYALEQAVNNGVHYNGFKLVEGRSNRIYESEEAAVKALEENDYTENEIYDKKIKGITEMEKSLGKKLFNEILGPFVIKPAGKPTLVPESDKRPEINTSAKAAEDFKNIIKN